MVKTLVTVKLMSKMVMVVLQTTATVSGMIVGSMLYFPGQEYAQNSNVQRQFAARATNADVCSYF